jgi:uncharacterized protein YjbJ (UPF0337 family)
MTWDQIARIWYWKQLTCEAKAKWSKLTEDELYSIAGQRDQFAGSLQKHYGFAKDQAETEADEFARTLGP